MSDNTRRVIEGILDGDGFHQTNGTSFQRWLNTHDEQVRADAKREALTEAADALAAVDPDGDSVYWDGTYYQSITDWLWERAAGL